MPKPFKFKNMLEKYVVPFTYIEKTEGRWEGNDYIEGGEIKLPLKGAILPLTEKELQYAEGGTYTTEDKKVYSTVPLKSGATVQYKGGEYTVQDELPLSDYTDVYIYFARRAGQ